MNNEVLEPNQGLLENLETVASFVGLKKHEIILCYQKPFEAWQGDFFKENDLQPSVFGDWRTTNNLKFNINWDWQIPVWLIVKRKANELNVKRFMMNYEESFFFKICETPEQSFPYLLSAIQIIQEAEQKYDWVDYKQNTKIITDKVLYDLLLKDDSILKNYVRYSITNTFVNPLICTLQNNDDSKISKIRVTRDI
jgi:hypothetical protein